MNYHPYPGDTHALHSVDCWLHSCKGSLHIELDAADDLYADGSATHASPDQVTFYSTDLFHASTVTGLVREPRNSASATGGFI